MKRILSGIALFLAGIGLALAAVNINTASVDELKTVKGIGKTNAEAIVEYRDAHGPFKTVDDLKNVKGFGGQGKKFNAVRNELTVGDTPAKGAKTAKTAKK